jgi:hypothetical protein
MTMERQSKPPKGDTVTNVQTRSHTEHNGAAQTQRKRLVFFVSTDPAVDGGPLRTAEHFAGIAAAAGLTAEIRLAAHAVRGIDRVGAPSQGVSVTVCPRAMEKYDVSEGRLDAIGARPRLLAEILSEVAEGRSVLIPVTHSIDDPAEA